MRIGYFFTIPIKRKAKHTHTRTHNGQNNLYNFLTKKKCVFYIIITNSKLFFGISMRNFTLEICFGPQQGSFPQFYKPMEKWFGIGNSYRFLKPTIPLNKKK